MPTDSCVNVFRNIQCITKLKIVNLQWEPKYLRNQWLHSLCYSTDVVPIQANACQPLPVGSGELTLVLSWVSLRYPVSGLTWVFAPTTPLDEADDKKDQYDESDGTHQADEPALSGYVYLVYVGWRHTQNTHIQGGTGEKSKDTVFFRPTLSQS